MKPAKNEVGGGVRLPKSFYERPLTPKEAQFATDNINIVWWYLDQQGLERAEWFDVVIFRYLISVKPVSYTHLDVYKRQGQGGPIGF